MKSKFLKIAVISTMAAGVIAGIIAPVSAASQITKKTSQVKAQNLGPTPINPGFNPLPYVKKSENNPTNNHEPKNQPQVHNTPVIHNQPKPQPVKKDNQQPTKVEHHIVINKPDVKKPVPETKNNNNDSKPHIPLLHKPKVVFNYVAVLQNILNQLPKQISIQTSVLHWYTTNQIENNVAYHNFFIKFMTHYLQKILYNKQFNIPVNDILQTQISTKIVSINNNDLTIQWVVKYNNQEFTSHPIQVIGFAPIKKAPVIHKESKPTLTYEDLLKNTINALTAEINISKTTLHHFSTTDFKNNVSYQRFLDVFMVNYFENLLYATKFEHLAEYIKNTNIKIVIDNVSKEGIEINYVVSYKNQTFTSKQIDLVGFLEPSQKVIPVDHKTTKKVKTIPIVHKTKQPLKPKNNQTKPHDLKPDTNHNGITHKEKKTPIKVEHEQHQVNNLDNYISWLKEIINKLSDSISIAHTNLDSLTVQQIENIASYNTFFKRFMVLHLKNIIYSQDVNAYKNYFANTNINVQIINSDNDSINIEYVVTYNKTTIKSKTISVTGFLQPVTKTKKDEKNKHTKKTITNSPEHVTHPSKKTITNSPEHVIHPSKKTNTGESYEQILEKLLNDLNNPINISHSILHNFSPNKFTNKDYASLLKRMLQTYLINIISKQQFENIDAYLKQTKIEIMILNITSHEINIKFSVNYKTFTLNSKMLNVIGFAQEINKTAPVIKKLSVTVPKTLYIFNQVQNENTYNSVDDTINIKVENLNNQKISFNWYVNELSKDESINNSWALDVNAPVLKIPYNFLNHAGTWYFTPVYEIDNQIHVLESITVEVVNKNNLPTISVKNDNVYTNQNVQILLNNTEFLKGNKYLYTLKENIAGSWYTINSTNSSNTIFYTAPSNSQVIQLMVDIQKVNADGSLSSVLNTNTINLNILSLGKLTISAPNQTIVDSTIDLKNINSTVKIVSQLLNSPILKPLYQWQTKNINNIWINIDGQTQPTLDINGINNQSWSQNPYTQSYRLVLTSSQNPDNYLVSNTINVTNPNISIGNVNVLLNNNQLSVNSNNSSIYNDANVKINAPFTLEAQVNDSSFPLNLLEYQWQILNPNGNWQNILGANYKTYTFTPKTYNPHQYRCQVSVMNDWDVGITYSKVVNITVPVSKATQEKYLQELEDYYGIYPETTKNGIISVRTPTEEQLEHQNELLENYFSSPTGLASIYDNLWYNYTALGGGEWKNIPNSLGKWMSNYQLIKVGTQPNGMVYIQLKVIKPHTDMYFSYSNSNGNTINQYFNEGDIFTFYLPFSLRNVVSQNHKNSVIQVTPSINANGKPQIKISFNESNLLFGADPGMLASNVQFPGFTITRNGVSVTNESWLKFSYELNGYNQAMKNLSVPWDTWYETPTYININTTNSNIKQFTPLCNDLILNETTKTTYNVQIDSGNQYTLSVNPEFTNGIIPLCKYQWYVNSQDSITNATAISNATSNVYTVSSDINSSSNITKYYFCKITYWDNGKQLSKTTSLYTFNFSKGSTISK